MRFIFLQKQWVKRVERCLKIFIFAKQNIRDEEIHINYIVIVVFNSQS